MVMVNGHGVGGIHTYLLLPLNAGNNQGTVISVQVGRNLKRGCIHVVERVLYQWNLKEYFWFGVMKLE